MNLLRVKGRKEQKIQRKALRKLLQLYLVFISLILQLRVDKTVKRVVKVEAGKGLKSIFYPPFDKK